MTVGFVVLGLLVTRGVIWLLFRRGGFGSSWFGRSKMLDELDAMSATGDMISTEMDREKERLRSAGDPTSERALACFEPIVVGREIRPSLERVAERLRSAADGDPIARRALEQVRRWLDLSEASASEVDQAQLEREIRTLAPASGNT